MQPRQPRDTCENLSEEWESSDNVNNSVSQTFVKFGIIFKPLAVEVLTAGGATLTASSATNLYYWFMRVTWSPWAVVDSAPGGK